ncbi:EAL domain-containing protein, partial [Tepidiphilus succinatimandens]|uniref:EAL domain-containing protein n=1 Tax=Tepidiphilus succinatimandens TaxID=224436 RepID=UPI00112F062B
HHIPQKALGHVPPIEAMKRWYKEKPELFIKVPRNRPGPDNFVKIDGAFIRGIEHSKTDEALVRNLARLCHDLGIQTVAEFVESQELLERVRELGVTHAQGYYIGLPRPDLFLPAGANAEG